MAAIVRFTMTADLALYTQSKEAMASIAPGFGLKCPLKSSPLTKRFTMKICSLQNENGFALSKMKFKTCDCHLLSTVQEVNEAIFLNFCAIHNREPFKDTGYYILVIVKTSFLTWCISTYMHKL